MSSVRAGADEAHRDRRASASRSPTHGSVLKGHVVGGRVFGYDNRHVFIGEDASGNPLKSHTERVVNRIEAAVVRRIFELYDSGEGLKRIATQLNDEGAVRPKPFVRKDPTKVQPVTRGRRAPCAPSSCASCIAASSSGTRAASATHWGAGEPEAPPRVGVAHVSRPEHLRIVDESRSGTAFRPGGRTPRRSQRVGRWSTRGRPPKTATQNLLAGLATCALCGGGLVVETSPRKRGRVPEYVCYRHRHNGTCTNALRMPVADMNEAVLQAVEQHALTPEAIEQVINLSERDDAPSRQDALAREQKDVAKRIARLVAAIETAGDVASLVAKLRELEARQQRSSPASCASLRPVPRLAPAVIENRLAEWRRLLRASTTQGRDRAPADSARAAGLHAHGTRSAGVDGYTFTGPDALRQAVHRHRGGAPGVGLRRADGAPRTSARKTPSTGTTAACWTRV